MKSWLRRKMLGVLRRPAPATASVPTEPTGQGARAPEVALREALDEAEAWAALVERAARQAAGRRAARPAPRTLH